MVDNIIDNDNTGYGCDEGWPEMLSDIEKRERGSECGRARANVAYTVPTSQASRFLT